MRRSSSGAWIAITLVWVGCFPGAIERDAEDGDTSAEVETALETDGELEVETAEPDTADTDSTDPETSETDSNDSETADTDLGDSETADTDLGDTDTVDTDSGDTDTVDTDSHDTETVTLNACGGLGALTPGEPGTSCGPCADGELVCDPADAEKNRTRCEGGSALNACQGCGPVEPALGTECDDCGLIVCDGLGGTRCAEPAGGCEVPLTCEDLACGQEQRECIEGQGGADAVCGGCVATYVEVGGQCQGQVVAPTGLEASTDLEDRVFLRWNAVLHATGYRLYRCAGSCNEAGPWVELLPVAIAQTSFPDQTAATPAAPVAPTVSASIDRPSDVAVSWAAVVAPLAPRYSYRVVAVGPTGESAPSGAAVGHLAERPTTGYELSVAGGAWQSIETTNFTDPDAAAPTLTAGLVSASQGVHPDKVVVSLATWSSPDGVSREYRVRAKTRFGVGAIGSASGRRKAGAVTLTWERSASSAPVDFAAIAGSSGPIQSARNYEDSDSQGIPPNGVVRHYRARLAAAGAAEVVSEPASGWRLPAPGVPQIQSVTTELTDRVEVRWAPVDGALGYHLYRQGTRITPSQVVACTSSPCVYSDLDAPAAGAWVAPSSVTATTNQTGGVTVSWNLPGRPKGARQLYEVSAINPAGESGRSPQVDGWRSAPALTGVEVKATVSGADTTHFVAADATSYIHAAAPLATFLATTLTATQGDHRAHARLTLTGGTLSQALMVGYQVRGQFSGGTTPWSTTANGRRAAGTISRAWEYASLANPTAFATLSTLVCATSNTSCNDTAASPLGVKRLYRATLSAPGATSLTTNTMEGWRLAFTYVDGGYGFTCAVDTGGRLWAWGGSQPTPHIRATGPFVDCSTGGEDLGQIIIASGTVCARSAAGDVAFGSLKDANALVPRTDLGTGVKSIQLGPLHACAVKADGQAVCWGQNFTGGVGDNTTEDRTSPATVVRWNGVALTGVVEVAVGTYHSCARTGGGSVWCWGFNGTGGLGDGSGTDRHHAVQVPNISSAVGLALGGGLFATHSCVLLSNGETRCFGSNTDGQLGDGTQTNKLSPATVLKSIVPALPLNGVLQITAMGTTTCARKPDGIWCWGSDHNGSLGNGEPIANSSLPVSTFVGSASFVAGRGSTSCVITDGGIRCWGSSSAAPVPILLP